MGEDVREGSRPSQVVRALPRLGEDLSRQACAVPAQAPVDDEKITPEATAALERAGAGDLQTPAPRA